LEFSNLLIEDWNQCEIWAEYLVLDALSDGEFKKPKKKVLQGFLGFYGKPF